MSEKSKRDASTPEAAEDRPLLEIRDLDIAFGSKRKPMPTVFGASLSVYRGETVAIIGYNRPRLYWSMAAAQWLGAIPIPVYADSVAEEMAYVLAHAEVTHAAVQDQEQRVCLSRDLDPATLPALVD